MVNWDLNLSFFLAPTPGRRMVWCPDDRRVLKVDSSVNMTLAQSLAVQCRCSLANSNLLSFMAWVRRGFLAARREGRLQSFFKRCWMFRTLTWPKWRGWKVLILLAEMLGDWETSRFSFSKPR